MKEIVKLEILQIRSEYGDIGVFLDERRRRLWCAARARSFDRMYQRGGVSAVSQATGVSRPTIYSGLSELEDTERLEVSRIRSIRCQFDPKLV